MSLNAGGFEPSFEIELEPEYPGDGDWKCRVVGFDRDGAVMDQFDSRWGTPLVVRFAPDDREAWVGMFAAGGLGSLRGAFVAPNPRQAVLVVDGLAYLLDVDQPTMPATIVHDQVHQVVTTEEPPLLLLVRFIDIVAVGADGVAWTTPRLCVGDLRVQRIDHSGIECTCDNLGGRRTITLDPTSGKQTSGTRLDSFWPPDALG